jgi:hypothetical protein
MIDATHNSYDTVSGNTKALLAHRIMTIPEYHGILVKFPKMMHEKMDRNKMKNEKINKKPKKASKI